MFMDVASLESNVNQVCWPSDISRYTLGWFIEHLTKGHPTLELKFDILHFKGLI